MADEQQGERFVTLETLADGVAGELFGQAMQRVLENVDDPNTDWKAKRTITLTFTVRADGERRQVAKVGVACATRLAGVKPMDTTVFIGRNKGVLVAREAFPNGELFPTPAARPELVEGVPPAAAAQG